MTDQELGCGFQVQVCLPRISLRPISTQRGGWGKKTRHGRLEVATSEGHTASSEDALLQLLAAGNGTL